MGKWNLNDPSNTFLSNSELWAILFSHTRDKIQRWDPAYRLRFFCEVLKAYDQARWRNGVEHPRVWVDVLIEAYSMVLVDYTYTQVVRGYAPWGWLPEEKQHVLIGLGHLAEIQWLALQYMPGVPTYDPSGNDANTLTIHMDDRQLMECSNLSHLSQDKVIEALEVLDAIDKKVSAQH